MNITAIPTDGVHAWQIEIFIQRDDDLPDVKIYSGECLTEDQADELAWRINVLNDPAKSIELIRAEYLLREIRATDEQ
jgi:hypothetical protein